MCVLGRLVLGEKMVTFVLYLCAGSFYGILTCVCFGKETGVRREKMVIVIGVHGICVVFDFL